MISVSGLNIYPVKSLAGVALETVSLDRFGPQGDRRWMVIDEQGNCMTQRECAQMALISAALDGQGVSLSQVATQIRVPVPAGDARKWRGQVWGDAVEGLDAGDAAAAWLGAQLGRGARLVYMADDYQRAVDSSYASAGETVSFADGFPLLLISQASLDDLNSRLSTPVPMNRFRPNLVVSGCAAFAEDSWQRIRINGIEFTVAKPCARCVMPSIDQASGEKDSEILRVLASYRRGEDRQTYFGQNLLHRGVGAIALADGIDVIA